MSVTRCLTICLCVTFTAPKKIEFPKELDRCHRDEPRVDDCLKKAIQRGLPVLSKGIPQVGLLPIDPLLTSRCNMQQYFGPVTMNLTMINVYTRGYSNLTIKRVRSKLSEYQFEIHANAPRLVLDGDYHLLATAFQLPIEGIGSFEIALDNVDATLRVEGKSQLRSGEEYLHVAKTPLTFQPETLKMNFKNLFGGNERLGKHANWFLNRHSMAVFAATRPILEEAVGKIIEGVTYPFFSKVPYNSVFL